MTITMTRDKLAKLLDGTQYALRLANALARQAKDARLVAVWASPMQIVFEGAISDDLACYSGGTYHVMMEGSLCDAHEEEDGECTVAECRNVPLVAEWGKGPEASWTFAFPVEHSTFRTFEDAEVYCVGIVFAMADVAAYLNEKERRCES